MLQVQSWAWWQVLVTWTAGYVLLLVLLVYVPPLPKEGMVLMPAPITFATALGFARMAWKVWPVACIEIFVVNATLLGLTVYWVVRRFAS